MTDYQWQAAVYAEGLRELLAEPENVEARQPYHRQVMAARRLAWPRP